MAHAYQRLEQVLRTGMPDREMQELTSRAFGGDPLETEKFAKAMEAMSAVLATELVEAVDFSNFRSCLDVGSGWGIFSRVIRRNWPEIQITMLDRPAVIEGAQQAWRKDFGNSIATFLGGDWHNDLPNGAFDLVLLSQVLHEEPEESAIRLLRSACNRVSTAGKLVVVQFDLADDKTGPLLSTIFNMNMLLETGGRTFTVSELRPILESEKMYVTDVLPLSGGRSAIVAHR